MRSRAPPAPWERAVCNADPVSVRPWSGDDRLVIRVLFRQSEELRLVAAHALVMQHMVRRDPLRQRQPREAACEAQAVIELSGAKMPLGSKCMSGSVMPCRSVVTLGVQRLQGHGEGRLGAFPHQISAAISRTTAGSPPSPASHKGTWLPRTHLRGQAVAASESVRAPPDGYRHGAQTAPARNRPTPSRWRTETPGSLSRGHRGGAVHRTCALRSSCAGGSGTRQDGRRPRQEGHNPVHRFASARQPSSVRSLRLGWMIQVLKSTRRHLKGVHRPSEALAEPPHLDHLPSRGMDLMARRASVGWADGALTGKASPKKSATLSSTAAGAFGGYPK